MRVCSRTAKRLLQKTVKKTILAIFQNRRKMTKNEKSDVTGFWEAHVWTENKVNFDHFAKNCTHFGSLFGHFPEYTRSFFLPPGILTFFQGKKKGAQKRAKIRIFRIFRFFGILGCFSSVFRHFPHLGPINSP
jgi:hypothetical protein